ncbi:MAG TPA: fatty acyl-AMP ligase [bacterium]|nr:fatty acyl-AMP ligase [bacterium]
MPSPVSLVDMLRTHAATQGRDRSLCFLEPGEDGRLSGDDRWSTYGDLDLKARTIAAALQDASRRGERALLLYPPGIEYVAAFLGCLYAGVVAVPIYPPDPMRLNRTMPRIQAIEKDAGAATILTTEPILSMSEMVFEHAPEFRQLQWIATDVLPETAAAGWKDPGIGARDVAFLQYTSGSTGKPKGVVLTHGNLLHNSGLIQRYMAIDKESVCIIWLPPYHDMGLIGGILQPLYTGYPCALLSPMDFLRKPIRWLQMFTQLKGTIGGGPNFAYDLCVRKVTPEERETLDLSTWKTAFNGAEPIRRDTLERFADAFAPCGFRPEVMFPCYGLAEATLMVSGGPHFQKPISRRLDPSGPDIVACGCPLEGQTILIVDPESLEPRPEGEVGEIWVSGPSVAEGYWNRPEETQTTFHAFPKGSKDGPFLRTGDLGFLHGGQLFVAGRLKDLVVIRGMKHHPHDIERTVEKAHESIRPGCVAAFSLDLEGEERLIIVAEIERRDHVAERIHTEIRAAVVRHHSLQAYEVLLINAGSIPKTSSGKIQRHACKSSFQKDALDIVSRMKMNEANV